MRYSYQADQWLPYSIAEIFAFFANAANLPRLMPAWQKARIDRATIIPPPRPPGVQQSDPDAGIAAGAGTRLTITFRPFPFAPFRVSWEAEISEFVWNDHFCDVQLSGPFTFWKHCHHVSPETRHHIAGTHITDNVNYQLPFGLFGRIAQHIFVRRQLQSTFAFRQRQLTAILAGSPHY